MRKTLFLIILTGCLVLTGCNFKNLAKPEEVIVKTDATYNFAIANLDSEKNSKLDFSQYFDIGKMLSESMGESSEANFNVYKYNDGSEFQQVMLHMPLKEIEFDFGESFKDMDFSKAVEGFDVTKEFTIPDVTNLDKSEALDLGNINQAINTGVTFVGTTSDQPQSVNFVTNGLFDTVSYSTGKFVIDTTKTFEVDSEGNITFTDSGSGFGFYPTGTMTLRKDGVTIASGTFVNGIAELDISGKTLSSTGMTLTYSGSEIGIPFIATIGSESKIKTATGVTLPSSAYNIPPVHVSFPLNLSEDLGQVTINEGSLTVDLQNPDTWTENVISNYTIDITGGLECHVSKLHPTDNLDGQTLKNQDIDAEATVSIVLADATIDFDNPPKVNVKTEIKKVSATVAMPDDFETTISKEMDVPQELTNFVKSIEWNETGFNIKYVNKLPEGNDLKLKIKSTFLGLTSDEFQTLEADGDAAIERELSFVNKTGCTTAFEGPGAITKFDVSGEVQLPGAQAGKLTVSNVEPGKTYSISIKIEPHFDWKEATIKMPENTNYQGQFNTNINKKAMFEALGQDLADKLDSIKIDKLPLYIFANIPDLDLFKDAGFGGVIQTYYATQAEGENQPIVKVSDPIPLLAKKSDSGDYLKTDSGDFIETTISTNAMPQLVKNAADEVTNDFGNPTIDFSNALNASTNNKDATLFLDYKIGLAGTENNDFTIKSSDLTKLQSEGKTAIRIDVVLLLSLDFTIEKPITIDLLELMAKDDEENGSGSGSGSTTPKTDQERDILGRAEATSVEDYKQFLDVVKYANLKLTNVKAPLKGELNLKIDFQNGTTPEIYQFGDGKSTTIGISKPADLISTYPLEPKIELIIGQIDERTGTPIEAPTTFGLKRNAAFGAKLSLGIKAEGDVKVFPIENKSNSNNGGNE